MHELDGRTVGAAIGHAVEQLVGHRGDRRFQPGDAPGGERAGDQAPDPRMPRRVQVQDPVRALDEYRVGLPPREILVESGLVGNAEAGVAQHRVDRVVPDDQHPARAGLDHLADLMQRRIERVRVSPALWRAEPGHDLYQVHGCSLPEPIGTIVVIVKLYREMPPTPAATDSPTSASPGTAGPPPGRWPRASMRSAAANRACSRRLAPPGSAHHHRDTP